MPFRDSKPIFIENSKIPVILSKISPIEIGAITLGPIVLSRGEMSDITKNHEAIHWQQYIELGIFGFIILYLGWWAFNLVKYRNGEMAYFNIPFEKEAYDNHENLEYLKERKRYCWLKAKKQITM